MRLSSIATLALLQTTLVRIGAAEQSFPEETEPNEITRHPELRGSSRLSEPNGNNLYHVLNEIPDVQIQDAEERDLFIRRICGDVERLFTSQYTCICTADRLPLQISYSCERYSPSRVGRATYGTRYEGAFVFRLLQTELSTPVSFCLTDVNYQAVRLGESGRFVPFGDFCLEATLTLDLDPLQEQVSARVEQCNMKFGDIGTCSTCEKCPNGRAGFYLNCPGTPAPLCLSNNITFFGAAGQTDDRDVFEALGLMEMMEKRVNEMITDEAVAREVNPSPQHETHQEQPNSGNNSPNREQNNSLRNDMAEQYMTPKDQESIREEETSQAKSTNKKSKAKKDDYYDENEIPWWVLLTSKGDNQKVQLIQP